jgi:hypothetical protein
MAHLASTLYRGVFRNGGGSWYARASTPRAASAAARAAFAGSIHCGRHPSEDAAAHARAV